MSKCYSCGSLRKPKATRLLAKWRKPPKMSKPKARHESVLIQDPQKIMLRWSKQERRNRELKKLLDSLSKEEKS